MIDTVNISARSLRQHLALIAAELRLPRRSVLEASARAAARRHDARREVRP